MRKARDLVARSAPGHLAAARNAWVGHEGLRIGISGWTYPPWRGVFYPKKLPQRLELSFASRAHNSIEINGSFYSLQRPSSYQRWYSETPAGFIFSVKGARFITHMKKLREVETPLANFFRLGSPLSPRETRSHSLAIPSQFRLERGTLPRILRDAAGRQRRRRQVSAETR
jgi:uncharacterized protein YecE (DUF72 family)